MEMIRNGSMPGRKLSAKVSYGNDTQRYYAGLEAIAKQKSRRNFRDSFFLVFTYLPDG